MKTIKKILIALLACLGVTFLSFSIYFFLVTKNINLDEKKLLLPDTQILIYDQNGEYVSHSSAFHQRNIATIECIPKHVQDAFVCTEDKRFYSHHGFDLIRIGKATLNNVRTASFREGASTISQQLIKNTHLSLEKTLSRKLKELKLTLALEKAYDKSEILEMYLNTIYFGHSCYGISAASEFYFNKQPNELTIAEGAMLAGLVRSPNNYSPFRDETQCLRRRKTVLSLMLSQGAINQTEYNHATNSPLPTTPNKQENTCSYAQYAIDELETIATQYNFPLCGKIELFTHLDKSLQDYVNSLADGTVCDKTFAVINHETHGYEAFYSTGKMKRSPGSLLKPLLVYAPAFEKGILSPATPILDEPINFSGYTPQNYGNDYHGYISAREALSLSLNIPAVKTLNTLGIQTATEYAKKLSLPIQDGDRTLALALGGMTDGIYFCDLLSAYTVFPCHGQFSPAKFLSKIMINGQTVYNQQNPFKNIFSPETAYLTTDVLKTAVQEGTAKKMRSLPFPIAAKTGTVGTKKGNTDAYTIAFTPQHTVGVWLGNKDNTTINYTGGGFPCELSKNILERIHGSPKSKNFNNEKFEKPTDVAYFDLDKISYNSTHQLLLADQLSSAEYRIKELFCKQYAPTKCSSIFSCPKIAIPSIQLIDGCAHIRFHSSPEFYHYIIERTHENITETVYDGKAINEFIDKDLLVDTKYIYTITPLYKDISGKAITLPSLLTTSNIHPPILDKPWWDY